MNKAKHKQGIGPAVLRFEAQLYSEGSVKGDTQTLLEIPQAISEQLNGMSKLEGTINGHPFRAAIEGRSLRVNKAMLKGAAAGTGDTVALAILGPEPAPVLPADLRAPLSAEPEAMQLWQDLTDLGQRDWLRWIDLAKTPETRARRVQRTVEQLAEGKRRPCCVNVYEFMLCRLQEAEQTRN